MDEGVEAEKIRTLEARMTLSGGGGREVPMNSIASIPSSGFRLNEYVCFRTSTPVGRRRSPLLVYILS